MSEFDDFISVVRSIYSSNSFIPLHEPRFLGNEKKYVAETIDSTFVSSVGKFVDSFEAKLAEYTSCGRAAAVVNGTSALQVALRVSGVSAGDEVVTQALTFVATANAISHNYAKPVFVDVDLDTMGMSPEALRSFLEDFAEMRETGTYNKKTGNRIAAIMPMHTFGFMCRIDEIIAIAQHWNVPVIEDCAESLGSFYRNRSSGSFGLMGAFSFNGNKIVTAGGGGAIVSKNPKYAEKSKYLTNTAKVPHQWEYFHDELGYNFRMPNLNAALILAQIEQIDSLISSKRRVFEYYSQQLTGFKFKAAPSQTEWNHWLISLEFNDRSERDDFLEFTNSNQVMTRPIWKLMFELPMYSDCTRDEQRNATYLADRIVNIPSSARFDL
jgi:aminotransferase in exopolysaccharide biosynthesis